MTVTRLALAVGLLLIVGLAMGPAQVSAGGEPVGGCGATQVEVCWVVCVTEPCDAAKVCVHAIETCKSL